MLVETKSNIEIKHQESVWKLVESKSKSNIKIKNQESVSKLAEFKSKSNIKIKNQEYFDRFHTVPKAAAFGSSKFA